MLSSASFSMHRTSLMPLRALLIFIAWCVLETKVSDQLNAPLKITTLIMPPFAWVLLHCSVIETADWTEGQMGGVFHRAEVLGSLCILLLPLQAQLLLVEYFKSYQYFESFSFQITYFFFQQKPSCVFQLTLFPAFFFFPPLWESALLSMFLLTVYL